MKAGRRVAAETAASQRFTMSRSRRRPNPPLLRMTDCAQFCLTAADIRSADAGSVSIPPTYRLTSKGPKALRHLPKRRPVGAQLAYTCRMRIITYRDLRPGRFTKPLERLRAGLGRDDFAAAG